MDNGAQSVEDEDVADPEFLSIDVAARLLLGIPLKTRNLTFQQKRGLPAMRQRLRDASKRGEITLVLHQSRTALRWPDLKAWVDEHGDQTMRRHLGLGPRVVQLTGHAYITITATAEATVIPGDPQRLRDEFMKCIEANRRLEKALAQLQQEKAALEPDAAIGRRMREVGKANGHKARGSKKNRYADW